MFGTRQYDPRSSALQAPRILTFRGGRLVSIALSVVVAPLALAACGLIGGNTNHGAAPVVIPTVVESSSADGSSPSSSSAAAEPPPTSTVTKTGIVVKTQTRIQVTTKTAIKTSVPPAITLTQTA
jgi:hypothetical protein